jgi:hypothetical protein
MNPFESAAVSQVRLASLVVTEANQVRKGGLDQRLVDEYAKRLAHTDPPPLWVARTKGQLFLCDGFHRYEALKRAKRRTAWAAVVPIGLLEARWYGAAKNRSHGLPLSSRDHRRMFRFFIDARMHEDEQGRLMSLREITASLGGVRSHVTIYNWLRVDFPSIARRLSRDAPDAKPMGDHTEKPTEQSEGDQMHTLVEGIDAITRSALVLDAEVQRRIAEEFRRALARLSATTETPPKRGRGRPRKAQ